jgi:hypothetical protein
VSPNGSLREDELAPIRGSSTRPGGKPLLRKDCAALYNDMDASTSVDLSIHETAMRRAYREVAAQQLARNYWCSLGRCGNAAVVGTSRHGLGINVDLMTGAQRAWVDQHGAAWGWSKKWSDAPNEWWHVTCIPSRATHHPSAQPTLRHGQVGPSIKKVQRLLRARGFKSVPGPGKKGYGFFGKTTLSAVKRTQHSHHMTSDGIVGSATWHVLQSR